MTQSTSFVALLIASTIITYIAGICLERTDKTSYKNIIVALSFISNIGILCFMKYSGVILGWLGADNPVHSLFLPIGISFYTFQALSYVMDCYRHKISAEKNIIRYALYVSFFPSLLSGPINKSYDLLPELAASHNLDLDNVKTGLQKMLWGYFLKLVIAARLSIVVDTVYANMDGFTGFSILVAAIFYLFMLYCDFAGYSQMAIGAAKILGITMKENFKAPFYSLSMSELWKRWHISLSSWLQEYLYYPLGGNKKGAARKYINIMIVFLVSGLWHGVTINYIVWGILNGLFIVVGGMTLKYRQSAAERIGLAAHVKIYNLLRRVGVYCLYGFSMIFFANSRFGEALMVIAGIFTRFSIRAVVSGEIFGVGLGVFNLLLTVVMIVFVLIIDGYCNVYDCDFAGLLTRIPTIVRWAMYIMIVMLIMFSANLTGKEFIYSTM